MVMTNGGQFNSGRPDENTHPMELAARDMETKAIAKMMEAISCLEKEKKAKAAIQKALQRGEAEYVDKETVKTVGARFIDGNTVNGKLRVPPYAESAGWFKSQPEVTNEKQAMFAQATVLCFGFNRFGQEAAMEAAKLMEAALSSYAIALAAYSNASGDPETERKEGERHEAKLRN